MERGRFFELGQVVSPRRLALDKKLDGMLMTSHKENVISMCAQEQDPACVRADLHICGTEV